MLNINYRFKLKFTLNYTDRKNNTKKKIFSFFARKSEICEFSGMTKNCDKIFLKEKIANFYKNKDFISFKLNLNEASNLFYKDLKENSENLISYIRPNKKNKDVLKSNIILNLEKYYRNSKIFN